MRGFGEQGLPLVTEAGKGQLLHPLVRPAQARQMWNLREPMRCSPQGPTAQHPVYLGCCWEGPHQGSGLCFQPSPNHLSKLWTVQYSSIISFSGEFSWSWGELFAAKNLYWTYHRRKRQHFLMLDGSLVISMFNGLREATGKYKDDPLLGPLPQVWSGIKLFSLVVGVWTPLRMILMLHVGGSMVMSWTINQRQVPLKRDKLSTGTRVCHHWHTGRNAQTGS